jgi:hypothetical protein
MSGSLTVVSWPFMIVTADWPCMTSALKAAETDWARATNLRTSVVLIAYMTTNSTKRSVIRSE